MARDEARAREQAAARVAHLTDPLSRRAAHVVQADASRRARRDHDCGSRLAPRAVAGVGAADRGRPGGQSGPGGRFCPIGAVRLIGCASRSAGRRCGPPPGQASPAGRSGCLGDFRPIRHKYPIGLTGNCAIRHRCPLSRSGSRGGGGADWACGNRCRGIRRSRDRSAHRGQAGHPVAVEAEGGRFWCSRRGQGCCRAKRIKRIKRIRRIRRGRWSGSRRSGGHRNPRKRCARHTHAARARPRPSAGWCRGRRHSRGRSPRNTRSRSERRATAPWQPSSRLEPGAGARRSTRPQFNRRWIRDGAAPGCGTAPARGAASCGALPGRAAPGGALPGGAASGSPISCAPPRWLRGSVGWPPRGRRRAGRAGRCGAAGAPGAPDAARGCALRPGRRDLSPP
jgi:hypothetical protein